MTSFELKIIAVITMFIDHSGAVLFPHAIWMRYVGRLSFPIYCFLIVEGYIHTHDIKKYLIRIGVFALISEIPFDLAFHSTLFYPDYQNVDFTLFFGLLALVLIDCFSGQIFWQIISTASMCLAASELQTDYRFIGVLLIVIMYLFRKEHAMRFASSGFVLIPFSNAIEGFGLLAFLPISFYNGKRGRHKWQMFFYIFYPAHLLFLAFVRRIIT